MLYHCIIKGARAWFLASLALAAAPSIFAQVSVNSPPNVLRQQAPAAFANSPANQMRCPDAGPQLCGPTNAQITGQSGAMKDTLTNPDAVKHRIDRSAMELPIQGWTRDLKYPVYPVAVMSGAAGVYYTTNENVSTFKEFDFDELRCEIGDADPAVLKSPNYSCTDGVCMSKEGAILGTDPRKKGNKKHKC